MPEWLIWYLTITNIIGALVMVSDKTQAIKGRKRVPESTLFALAAAGAAIGVWFAMYAAHHKLRKAKFKFGIPCIAILQFALLIFLAEKGILIA